MIFADASALIAIITDEAGADGLAARIEEDREPLCSAISVWETVAGLCRSYNFSVPTAREHVRRFLNTGKFRFVTIGEREFELATEAYAQFGKGRHQAALNMGDCFAYACTKSNGATLLYMGNDFAKTDMA